MAWRASISSLLQCSRDEKHLKQRASLSVSLSVSDRQRPLLTLAVLAWSHALSSAVSKRFGVAAPCREQGGAGGLVYLRDSLSPVLISQT